MFDANDHKIARLEAQVAMLTQLLAGKPDTPKPVAGDDSVLQHQLILAIQQQPLLQTLMDDPTVNDVLINGSRTLFVERAGKLEPVQGRMPDESSVMALAEAIAARCGRTMDHHRPLMDARLPDGSRVNIIAPPLAIDGTTISIRKFSQKLITLDQMVKQQNLSAELAGVLEVLAKSHLNIIISGGTGSGKTTLLNAIAQCVDPKQRLVTIEDAAELRLPQPHVVRLETKPASGQKKHEEVTTRDLVRNALRMRPDRIIIGEVRGAEAFDLLQAMNTGHEGSFTTVHANHPRDALSRISNMVNMANLHLPTVAIRGQIASAINVVVQISRMRDGHRRVTYISEVVGMEGEVITMQDLFAFQQKGEGADGKLLGEFRWAGIMPRFLRRVHYYGQLEKLSAVLGTKLHIN
jgi:pilus assembly protein CpaF